MTQEQIKKNKKKAYTIMGVGAAVIFAGYVLKKKYPDAGSLAVVGCIVGLFGLIKLSYADVEPR